MIARAGDHRNDQRDQVLPDHLCNDPEHRVPPQCNANPSKDAHEGCMLQFTSSVVLLVRGLADRVGNAKRDRNLLASSTSIISSYDRFRHGDRLHRQLA
jgi:hypothetical protein